MMNSEMRECQKCDISDRKIIGSVIGDRENLEVVLVGEAPGAMEVKEGKPFIGPAGQLLRSTLKQINVENYALVNVLKCRPPKNRTPSSSEVQNCLSFLEAQIEKLGCKNVVALGQTAEMALGQLGIECKAIQHPSYFLRKELPDSDFFIELYLAIKGGSKQYESRGEAIPQLHNHDEFSIADSIRSPEEMVIAAKQMGIDILAQTNHGTLAGVYDFADACKKHGVKGIVGYEAYVLDPLTLKQGHLTLWVLNETGWYNLVRAHNIAATRGGRNVLINLDELNGDGLAAGTACIGGLVAKIWEENVGEATFAIEALGKKFKNLFLEVMPHPEVELDTEGKTQAAFNNFLLDESRRFELPVIVTTDSHYSVPEEKEPKMQAQACIWKKKDSDYFPGNTYYFQSVEEICKNFREMGWNDDQIEYALDSTFKWGDELLRSGAGEFSPPIYDMSELAGEWDDPEKLRRMAFDGLDGRAESIGYEDRLNLELERIEKQGLSWYMLIMAEFCKRARKDGIKIGPGRGSVGGSLVAYAVGITDVHSVDYQLYFDRFMSADRIDIADVDLDLAQSRRADGILILQDILGGQTAQISTFSRWQPKSAMRDAAWWILGNSNRVGEVSKNLQALQISANFQGHIKNKGIHAAGIVTLPSLRSKIPLARGGKAVEYELSTVEKVGLLKFDLLGLKTLDLIDRVEKEVA